MLNKIKNISISDRIDYILIYLLLAISGNHAFDENIIFILMVFFLSVIMFFIRKRTVDILFSGLVLVLTFILLTQALIFDFFPEMTLFGFYVRILIAYFILKVIGRSFIEKLVKVMIFLALISFMFFILINIIPSFPSAMKSFALESTEYVEPSTNYFVASYYTPLFTFRYMPYNPISFVRNPGMFWEAGAFGGYLIVVFMLNIMRTGIFLNKQNFVFILGILTTASTASFVALMAISFFYLLTSSKYKLLKTILLPIVSILGFFMFTYLDFLGAKIEDKLRLAEDPSVVYTTTSSRFVDALRDMEAFKGHELLGRGINKETRFTKMDKQSGYKIRTNGFTDHLVRFGGIFFIITFILMYYSFYSIIKYFDNINKLFAIYSILIIFLILQSETYFKLPFFWTLLMFYSVYNNKKGEKDR